MGGILIVSQYVLQQLILKIKFIIYENNLIIGKANKLLLPFIKKYLSLKELEGNQKIIKIKLLKLEIY